MGDFNRIEGAVEVPTPEGSIWLSRQVPNRLKAEYEDWLEGTARRRTFELHQAGQLTATQFKQTMRSVDASSAAGTFSWGGDAWQESLQQIPGIVKMVCLLAAEAKKRGATHGLAVDEGTVLRLMANEAVAGELVNAIKNGVKADPNFLSPPTREKGE